MDDFNKLSETEHMLRWFVDEPYVAIRSKVEGMLRKQVEDSCLTEFRVTSAPQWLTGARPSTPDNSNVILVRSAVAFEFALSVESHGRSHNLSGVFTWAAVHLDQPGKQKHQFWIDLDGNLTTFGDKGKLMTRVYFELEGVDDES